MSTSTQYLNEISTTTADGYWRLPALAIVSGIAMLIGATMLLLRGVEPIATWYYNFAWYPVLLAGDGVVALTGGVRGRKGEFLLLGNKRFLATVLFWSAVVWFFYEVFNFRLQNWYYVNLPPDRLNRWAGTFIAFATVLPAVFVGEAVWNGVGVAKRVRWPKFTVTNAVLNGMRIAGVIMLALVLAWPKYFFPLVWGATMLLVEPENYKGNKSNSLLADLERGEPGRLLRLLLGGACIGFIWEMLNINARAKWIYTVPGVEELKIFEMPVPGFFGFPPFAVECYILWQALVRAGVAVPRLGNAFPASTAKRVFAFVAGLAFCVGTQLGMDAVTTDSHKPSLADLPLVPAADLERAGYDAFLLARASAADVARTLGADTESAAAWIDEARLVTLRGLGTENLRLLNALGITSLDQLAHQDSKELVAKLEELTGRDFVDARVRVWIRGARRITGSS